jgi:hypothetical protein
MGPIGRPGVFTNSLLITLPTAEAKMGAARARFEVGPVHKHKHSSRHSHTVHNILFLFTASKPKNQRTTTRVRAMGVRHHAPKD